MHETPDEIEEIPLPTPEIGDHYVGVKIQLPRGTSNAQGRVLHRARDNDVNVVGRVNVELALDTRTYVIEFENGEEAELSVNAITQSMHTQCDPKGNQYLMFDSIIDF